MGTALDHHVDLTIRLDPELPPTVVMSALFGRLHRALVARGQDAQHADPVAIVFPGWQRGRAPTLGRVLRLVGSAAALHAAMTRPWLGAVAGHVTVGPLARVPEHAAARVLRRVQAKSGVERLRRRRMKRHGVDAAEAARLIPEGVAERLDLPFVQLRSASTAQPFSLFLRLSESEGAVQQGRFNTYGLSSDGNVPWF